MFALPQSCGNGCGLIAAFIGVIGFGAFGAPLKGKAANSVNADPFVLQTYKSTMSFLTSFLVLALGVEYKFSPYGLISGLLWVTGGACGIFGIRNSGLAISVGMWSSITVLVSFAWGILVFGETVKSVYTTAVGVCMMIVGFIGMAYFSSPAAMLEHSDENNNNNDDDDDSNNNNNGENSNNSDNGENGSEDIENMDHQQFENDEDHGGNQNSNVSSLKQPLLEDYALDVERQEDNVHKIEVESATNDTSPSTTDDEDEFLNNGNNNNSSNNNNNIDDKTTVIFLGMKWNRRRLGLLGAAMDGFLGGMMLVPMHFSAYKGEEYIISFGTGAMAVTLFFWLLRFTYSSYEEKSMKKGWENLPSLHIKTLIIPGGLAGLVWSIGNIGLIFSVSFLGESIGMSIVQSNMIVSGMIGIIWYEEIKGVKSICLWSLSAILTFVGIVFLSSQHKSS